MALYKCTMIFDYDGYGWSESYVMSDPASQGLNIAYKLFTKIAQNRISLLVQKARLSYIRIGTIGTRFATQTSYFNNTGQWGLAPYLDQTGGLGLHPNDSLLLRWTPTIAGPEKSTFIRGIPQVINQNGVYVPTPNWSKALSRYFTGFNSLAGVAMGWVGVLSNTRAPLMTYAQNLDETVLITVKPIPATGAAMFAGLAIGSKIVLRVSGVNYKSVLNGTNNYLVVSPTQASTVDKIAVQPYQFGGSVEFPTFGFTGIAAGEDERLMTRKCGREYFLEHGKSSRRTRY